MTDTIKFIEYLVDKNIINDSNTVKILTDFVLKEDELKANCIQNISNVVGNVAACASDLVNMIDTKSRN